MKEMGEKFLFTQLSEITKGMSSDQKYFAMTDKGVKYLIRVFDAKEYELKKAEFDRMKALNRAGIPMQEAIDFGVCNEGKSAYMILSWIEGVELEKALKKLNNTKRYQLGYESGQILKKIHRVSVQTEQTGWYDRYFSIIDERLKAYENDDVTFEGDTLIRGYIEKYRNLIRNRPQCILHGDYHMGNMILMPNSRIGVIDWQTVDFDNFGDPWYEFNRIGIEYSSFASGQIDGYFNGNVPDEFWMIFIFYFTVSYFTSVVWAKYCAPEELESIIKMNQKILMDTDCFRLLIPNWYQKSEFTVLF